MWRLLNPIQSCNLHFQEQIASDIPQLEFGRSTGEVQSLSVDRFQTMNDSVRHAHLVSNETMTSKLNPLKFRRFLRQFNSRVVPNTDDDEERLSFLEQFTKGEPNKIVSHLDGTVGYQAALHELHERYGDPEIIASCFLKKALTWPAIKPNDAKSLDEFGIFLFEFNEIA